VGVARKDGENGAQAVLEYLQTLPPVEDPKKTLGNLQERLGNLDKPVITKAAWRLLEKVEKQEAERLGLEEFKYLTNKDMLAVIEQVTEKSTA
jgi:ferredoxin--NADP+ reductase